MSCAVHCLAKCSHLIQAMFVDFGYAENVGGECILRFDDTNPEAEKQEYIDHINDIVQWMGYKPSKVTQDLTWRCAEWFVPQLLIILSTAGTGVFAAIERHQILHECIRGLPARY